MDSFLLDAVSSGDRRALSRAITRVEKGEGATGLSLPEGVIGITGPPGAGKSTLISRLIEQIRSRGETVGVLAVDPSSPLTGGAILGDRIRMQGHIDDEGVFIRSMAARGHLGGLSAAAAESLALMSASGLDRLIVETVGVGQSEVEVMNVTEAVVLVVGPDWGDQVQADKAGVVEVADVFVVNKGDRPGSADVARALRDIAGSRPVLVASAVSGDGVDQVLQEIDRLVGDS